MNIKKLYQGYLNKLQQFSNEQLINIITNGNNNDITTELTDVSEFILNKYNNIIFEKTEINLPLQFLFIGNKIIYNSEELNYEQNEFNNYIQSQMGYILSGRWKNINKPSNVDKNTSLLWVGRFNFDNVKISYNDESLQKLCLRKHNMKINIWAPTLNEKQIIFDNLIKCDSPIIKKQNNIYNILSINLSTTVWYITNSFNKYEYRTDKKIKFIKLPHDTSFNDYIKINKLIN